MINESIVQQAARRERQTGTLLQLYLWFYQRGLTTILMTLVVFNLLYSHFFLPEGLAGLDYEFIITRWNDTTWGLYWRTLDWLLVVLGFAYFGQALRRMIDLFLQHPKSRTIAKTCLNLVVLALIMGGAQIIFNSR